MTATAEIAITSEPITTTELTVINSVLVKIASNGTVILTPCIIVVTNAECDHTAIHHQESYDTDQHTN